MTAGTGAIPYICGGCCKQLLPCEQVVNAWNALAGISMSGVFCATEIGTSCPIENTQTFNSDSVGPYTALPSFLDIVGNRTFAHTQALGGHDQGENQTVTARFVYQSGNITHVRFQVRTSWTDVDSGGCDRIDYSGDVVVLVPWECIDLQSLLVGTHNGAIAESCDDLQASVTVHSIA